MEVGFGAILLDRHESSSDELLFSNHRRAIQSEMGMDFHAGEKMVIRYGSVARQRMTKDPLTYPENCA